MASPHATSSQPTLTLYRGFPISNQYVWSPFVTKLEARLRFGSLAYRLAVESPKAAPRGKLPYLVVSAGEHLETLSDTTLIIEQLVQQGILDDANAKMSGEERAIDLAVRSLLENRVCFYQGYERWMQNYYTMRDGALAMLPWPVRIIVGILAWRANQQMLWGQGTARFSAEEIKNFRKEAWEAINELLVAAKKATDTGVDGAASSPPSPPFWLSRDSEPADADATLYGFIASSQVCDAAPDTRTLLRTFPVIMDYARRIHDRYFPDYEGWE